MRKVMPGCFLGWNRVGFLARAIGFNGGVGYGGKVPQKVEKKKGFGGVFRNAGAKIYEYSALLSIRPFYRKP